MPDTLSAGRPLKYTPQQIEIMAEEFFQRCDDMGDPYTITGLALALDTSRKVLCEYEERDEFRDIVKKIKTRVENYAEKKLYTGTPTGPIFALKNFGWSDKQDLNLGGQSDNPIKAEVTVKFVE